MSEDRQITRSAGVVGLFTLLSRVLGLIRDAVVAAAFPKGATDAFFVAYTIPNVLRRLLAEGALTVAFIPVFTRTLEQEGEDRGRRMLANMLGAVLLVLTVVVGLGVATSPWLVKAFAYGLAGEPARFDLAVHLTRVMFAFLLTVGLTALAMGALNTLRHFTAPALAPAVLNIFIILPASAGLGALAVPLTSVLFQRGQFNHAMAVETAVTLLGFLGGLWAGSGVRQRVPVFHAILLGAVVAGAVVYFVLCKVFRVPELDALVGAFRRRAG